MRWRLALIVSIVALVGACTAGSVPSSAETSTTSAPVVINDPARAAAEMIGAVGSGRYEAAARLTAPDQIPIVAMIEGLGPEDASGLQEGGGALEVGANFWSGFDEGLEQFVGFDAGEFESGEVREFVVDGVSFAAVDVVAAAEGETRRLILRRDDDGGWRTDLLASFAPALVGKVAQVADTLRGLQTDYSGRLLASLSRQIPSLKAALELPEPAPELSQAVVQAIAAIGDPG